MADVNAAVRQEMRQERAETRNESKLNLLLPRVEIEPRNNQTYKVVPYKESVVVLLKYYLL